MAASSGRRVGAGAGSFRGEVTVGLESDTLAELSACYAEGVRLRRELAEVKRHLAEYDDTVLPGGKTVMRSRSPGEREMPAPFQPVRPPSPSQTARERAARLLQQRERVDRLRSRSRRESGGGAGMDGEDGDLSSGSEAELAGRAMRMEDATNEYDGRGMGRRGHNERLQRAFSSGEAELADLAVDRDPYVEVIADAEEEASARARERDESPGTVGSGGSLAGSSPGSFGNPLERRSSSPEFATRSRSPSPTLPAVGPDPAQVVQLKESLRLLQADWHILWKLTKGGKGRAHKRNVRVKMGAPSVLLWESRGLFGYKTQKSFHVKDMYFGDEFSASVVREGRKGRQHYKDEFAILFEQEPGSDEEREVLIVACTDAEQYKLWTAYRDVLRWHAQPRPRFLSIAT